MPILEKEQIIHMAKTWGVKYKKEGELVAFTNSLFTAHIVAFCNSVNIHRVCTNFFRDVSAARQADLSDEALGCYVRKLQEEASVTLGVMNFQEPEVEDDR